MAPAQTANKPAPVKSQNGGVAVQRISKQAEAAREANKLDDAISLYKRGVALQPDWEEGWWYLGSLNYDLDNYSSARDAFKHLTIVNPKIAVGWGMLGLSEFEIKQYDLSLSHLRHAVELGVAADQNISDVIEYHLALLLTRSEHYEEALRAISVFSQRHLTQPQYVEAMGLAALRKPLLPNELPPTERELVMDTGRTMYDAAARKPNEASLEFQLLLDKYPREPNIHYLYGSFLLLSDADQALVQLKKELEILPTHVPALVTIASEYVSRHEYNTAFPYAERAVAANPESFAAHAVLGRVLTEGDLDPPRGLKELEQAEKLAPTSPQVRIALATAYAKAGKVEDATRERQEFLRLRKALDASQTIPQ